MQIIKSSNEVRTFCDIYSVDLLCLINVNVNVNVNVNLFIEICKHKCFYVKTGHRHTSAEMLGIQKYPDYLG